jgi:hypothetical protein
MEDRGAPINRTPMIDGREVDLYRLFRIVYKLGGHARVTNKSMWQQVAKKLGFETAWCINQVKLYIVIKNVTETLLVEACKSDFDSVQLLLGTKRYL